MRWLFNLIFGIEGKRKQVMAEHYKCAQTGFSILGLHCLAISACFLYMYLRGYTTFIMFPNLSIIVLVLCMTGVISLIIALWASLCCVIDLAERLIRKATYNILNTLYLATRRFARIIRLVARELS